MAQIPEHLRENIRPQWNRVIRRIQAEGCKQTGYAVMEIRILVGPDGNPVLWTEPDVTRIEPKYGMSQIMASLMGMDGGIDKA